MLQNFGTALSREQMKNVKGGDQTLEAVGDGGTGCTCYTKEDCGSTSCNKANASCVSYNGSNACVYF